MLDPVSVFDVTSRGRMWSCVQGSKRVERCRLRVRAECFAAFLAAEWPCQTLLACEVCSSPKVEVGRINMWAV